MTKEENYEMLINDFKIKCENLKELTNENLLSFLQTTTRWEEQIYLNKEYNKHWYKMQDYSMAIKKEIISRMGKMYNY